MAKMQLSSDQVTAWEGCDLIWRGSWAAWESPGLQLSLTKLVGGGGGHHQCGRTVDTLHPFVFHTTLAPQPVRSYFNKSLTFGFVPLHLNLFSHCKCEGTKSCVGRWFSDLSLDRGWIGRWPPTSSSDFEAGCGSAVHQQHNPWQLAASLTTASS